MRVRTSSIETHLASLLLFLCGALALLSPTPARAEPARESQRLMALGLQLDLLPTLLSAAHGKAGYAPQIWLGIDPVRVRLI
ncbi:MAG: hypothetical protein RLZZ450_752, partial [Pseudomonadota bacterium]